MQDELISKRAAINAIMGQPPEPHYPAWYAEQIENLSEAIIRCKHCKHFETDVMAKVDGIPLIVAHEICMRWGDGCKTSENGFCFMAERSGYGEGKENNA